MASLGLTWEFILVTTVSVFTIVNPLGAAPLFFSFTSSFPRPQALCVARRASIACAIVLSLFALLGERLFRLIGVSIPAVRIAGACLVFLNALDMLRGANVRTRVLPEEQKEAAAKEDVSIIPLAIPLLAGPGAITTVIILMIRSQNWVQCLVVLLAIVIVSILTFIILSSSTVLLKAIGPSGVRVMNRLMGLLLAAISIQFMINGIKDLIPDFIKLIHS